MKVPFYNIESWKRSNEINITNWQKCYRDLVTNTLWSNRSYPSGIKKMCAEILNN